MTFFCARIEYTVVSRFKKEQRCVNVDAPYLHAFLVMTRFFNKQYFENEWNDFINSNYATDCKNLTLFSSLNYFISHDMLKLNPRLTIFFQDLSVENSHANRIFISTCIDHVNLQNSLESQDFSCHVHSKGVWDMISDLSVLLKCEDTVID